MKNNNIKIFINYILIPIVLLLNYKHLLTIFSLCTSGYFYNKPLMTNNNYINPLPMIDISMSNKFDQTELDKVIHMAKNLRQPVVVRNVISQENVKKFTNDYYVDNCNNSVGKYIPNFQLESIKNVDLKKALNIDKKGGLYQSLNCCNNKFINQIMPINESYFELCKYYYLFKLLYSL